MTERHETKEQTGEGREERGHRVPQKPPQEPSTSKPPQEPEKKND
jgi:hypothetical protein